MMFGFLFILDFYNLWLSKHNFVLMEKVIIFIFILFKKITFLFFFIFSV